VGFILRGEKKKSKQVMIPSADRRRVQRLVSKKREEVDLELALPEGKVEADDLKCLRAFKAL